MSRDDGFIGTRALPAVLWANGVCTDWMPMLDEESGPSNTVGTYTWDCVEAYENFPSEPYLSLPPGHQAPRHFFPTHCPPAPRAAQYLYTPEPQSADPAHVRLKNKDMKRIADIWAAKTNFVERMRRILRLGKVPLTPSGEGSIHQDNMNVRKLIQCNIACRVAPDICVEYIHRDRPFKLVVRPGRPGTVFIHKCIDKLICYTEESWH